MTVFFRVLDAGDKAEALRKAIEQTKAVHRFELNLESLAAVPGSAFAYWITPSALAAFRSTPRLGETAKGWVGLQTNDDFRWIRTWWEAPYGSSEGAAAVPFAKGGAFSPFYADVNLSLRWGADGYWIKSWKVDQLRQGVITANNSKCWNESQYFQPGITWPSRTQTFGPRALPANCIFAHKGPAAFVENGGPQQLLALLSLMNSRPFAMLVETRLNAADATARSYEVGLIEQTPLPRLNAADKTVLAELAYRYWQIMRSLDTCTETSHAFKRPALLSVSGHTLEERAARWAAHVSASNEELRSLQSKIDDKCFDLYKFDISDRGMAEPSPSAIPGDGEDEADGEAAEHSTDAATLAAELISWAVFVAFGRFDLGWAANQENQSSDIGPFDPLPAYSPGMIPPDGTSAKVDKTMGGILVDDPGHSSDLHALVRGVLEQIFGSDDADRWVSEISSALGAPDDDLRSWIRERFFEFHLKRYSKSRRKAPIILQLGVRSGRFSVWVYSHALTRDSMLQIQNDFVAPKLAREQRNLASMIEAGGEHPADGLRREIETQREFIDELQDFLHEISRAALIWQPTLDDGITLAMAPLWRLVPQHKGWQKELKVKFDEMCAGKHDWSHISMHLWPERVVQKCTEDRSLAIAHGLESTLWFEDEKAEWRPYDKPKMPISQLIRERTSASVKAALKSLIEAPNASTGLKRSRKSKVA